MEKAQISFIVLTWNSQEYINNCISSIADKCRQENIPYEILVVDNGSKDKTRDILSSWEKEITLISFADNRGTTYGRNLALKQAEGEVICFLDSDAALKEGSLKKICQELSARADTGIIAPKVIFPDGRRQRSIRKFPSILHKAFKLKRFFSKDEPAVNEYYRAIPEAKAVTVDSALSACWFFNKTLVDEVGLLDEKIFYAPEDLDYCLRTWRAGKSILYYPFFTVEHFYQRITYKWRLVRIMFAHCGGLFYYFLKHKYAFRPPRYGSWERP